jgi:beta-lactamase superfamily II metal-dependent hydrolase
MSEIEIRMYKALRGDAFLLQFDNDTNIMIDTGFVDTYDSYIKNDLNRLHQEGKNIDLLVFTHVDDDHINGGKKLLKENGFSYKSKIIEIKEIWLNSYRHLQFAKAKVEKINSEESDILKDIIEVNSYINNEAESLIDKTGACGGTTLASLIYGFNYNWNDSFDGKAVCTDNKTIININEVKITMLSPDRNKLEKLAQVWLDELNEKRKDFSISGEFIFDDAFEEYIRNKRFFEESQVENTSFEENQMEDWCKFKGKIDNTEVNGSSISFILEYKGKRLLFLGDCHEDIIIEKLTILHNNGNNLVFDVVKLSHHGSERNNFNLYITQ